MVSPVWQKNLVRNRSDCPNFLQRSSCSYRPTGRIIQIQLMEFIPLQAVPLTTYPGKEIRPDFSPEGDRIVFMWPGPDEKNPDFYDFDIWEQQIGPGDPFPLTSYPGLNNCPRWSRDGQLVAFARMLPDQIAVMTVPALGGPERDIAQGGSESKKAIDHGLSGISWTPDGTCLVLSFRPSGQDQAQIFLFSISTGDLKALTFPPEGTLGDYYGEISPDGEKIAFFRRVSNSDYDLYVQFLSGEQPERLIYDNFDTAGGITWLPGSQEIIFSAGPPWHARLWRIDISESKPHLLMGFGEKVARHFPSVSAKGDRLAYVETTAGSPDVWRSVNPRKNDLLESPKCLISSSLFDGGAVPSPDGEKIGFMSNRSGSMEIYVCNKDGSQQKPMTDLKALCSFPSWSPDGRWIAFDGKIEDFNIYVVNTEDSKLLQLTDHPLGGHYTHLVQRWKLDLLFLPKGLEKDQIWKIPAKGGEAIQVTKRGGVLCPGIC